MAADGTIQFLHVLGRLKDTPRRGWVENGHPNPESVADHMYRMAVMCMLAPCGAGLDRARMVRMALCHDMAEAVVGDITPAMRVPADAKHARELRAIVDMTALLAPANGGEGGDGPSIRALWEEYEAQATPESRFVRDMDLLEMVLQAHDYEARHALAPPLAESPPNAMTAPMTATTTATRDLGGFFQSGHRIQHPWARAIFERLAATRRVAAANAE